MIKFWPESARWTENDVSWKSDSSKAAIQSTCERAILYLQDKDKNKRLKSLQCVYCYYSGPGLAGQAMTQWNCRVCLEEKPLWSNTDTPLICNVCAEAYKLCKECGADLHLRMRRSNCKILEGK